MLKPAPVIEVEFTITGDVPVDVSVNDRVVAVFTVTLPKLRLAGFTVNCGFTGGSVAIPEPLKPTTVVLPLAESLLIDS